MGNGRKLSAGHSEQFWETGGNCPLVILSYFGKQEEKVPTYNSNSIGSIYSNRRKLYWEYFFQRIIQSIIAGGKYPRRIEFWENKFPGRLSLVGFLVWEDRIQGDLEPG